MSHKLIHHGIPSLKYTSGLWLWLAQKLFGKSKYENVRSILELLIAFNKPISFNLIYSSLKYRDNKLTPTQLQSRNCYYHIITDESYYPMSHYMSHNITNIKN